MEVILLQKIANLGDIGDRVKVKPGFGRNYLLPGGKATLATPENIARFEARRAELEAKAAADLSSARSRAAALEGFKLSITAKAGSEGWRIDWNIVETELVARRGFPVRITGDGRHAGLAPVGAPIEPAPSASHAAIAQPSGDYTSDGTGDRVSPPATDPASLLPREYAPELRPLTERSRQGTTGLY